MTRSSAMIAPSIPAPKSPAVSKPRGTAGWPGLIHNIVELQAARNPRKTALVCGEESITYGELNVRANQLAFELASLGVRTESRVGLFGERNISTIVSILAI